MDENAKSQMDCHGYVYIATAPELLQEGVSKVGVTGRIRSRMKAHRSNSSSPYALFCFQCFRFESLQDARQVEAWVKRELRKLGLTYRENSSEFFQIEPSRLSHAVREGIQTLKLVAIDEFPPDLKRVWEKSGDFVSLPIELLQCLEANEAEAYWHGARDALWALSRLRNAICTPQDALELHELLEFNRTNNAPAMSETFAMYFRNHSTKQSREAGFRLTNEIKEWSESGFSRVPGGFSIQDWRTKPTNSN